MLHRHGREPGELQIVLQFEFSDGHLSWLPSSAGGGVAEGRGGVVKLSFTNRFNVADSFTIPRLPRITVQSFAETSRGLALESLEGKKFRRQHAIGPYITDFYGPECLLVIELDGVARARPLEIELGIRLITPPRPSATPPPAEEGKPIAAAIPGREGDDYRTTISFVATCARLNRAG